MYCVDIRPSSDDVELEIISIAKSYSLADWNTNYFDGGRVLSFGFYSSDDIFMFLRHLSDFTEYNMGDAIRFYLDTDN